MALQVPVAAADRRRQGDGLRLLTMLHETRCLKTLGVSRLIVLLAPHLRGAIVKDLVAD